MYAHGYHMALPLQANLGVLLMVEETEKAQEDPKRSIEAGG